MWWQDQIYLFGGMQFPRDVSFLALAMIVDAATGFSKWFAAKLKMEAQRDALLLSIMVLLLVQFLIDGDFFRDHTIALHSYIGDGQNELKALVQRRQELYALDVWFLWGLVVTSGVVCTALAMRQGRSALVWLVLGPLGNVGSIIWLFMRRRETEVTPLQSAPASRD